MRIAILTAVLLMGAVSTGYAGDAEAPPAKSDCAPQCTHVVTTRKVVGHQWKMVNVPIYRREKKVVKDDCCAPPVETQPTKVEEPPPQVVTVKKKIIVIEKPEIIRVPAPPITVLERQAPPIVQGPPVVVAPPPPAIVQHRMVCCPPNMNLPNLPRCSPQQRSFNGEMVGPRFAEASWTNQGRSDLCVGRPRGVPFECVSPSTGQTTNCVCR